MKNIKKIQIFLGQSIPLAVAGQLLLALSLSFLAVGQASAGQMTARSIEMSDSAPSGGSISSGVGSGTRVAYDLTFTPSATASTGGIVIDFCTNSALAGDTCTAPTAFNVNRATTVVQAGQSAACGANAFATYTSDATNNRIIITRATAQNITGACSINIGDGVAGTGNGFTNPSTTGTFYARVYTYATAAAAQAHNTGTPSGYIDSGGIALSTANVITISARVAETLTFCVSAAVPTANCGGTSLPSLTIGHNTVKTIDSSAVDTGSVYTQISTNALSGAIVKMHHAYACGGLSLNAGSTCGIPAVGAGAGSASGMTLGTAAFGLFVAIGAPLSGGSGSTTPDPNYYTLAHSNIGTGDLWYGMDTTTSGNNATTTFGDPIMSCAGPVNNVNTQMVFAATASNVTPAGLYSATMSLIVNATF